MKEMRRRWSKIAGLWCFVMHEEATLPIHGHYQCPKCHRVYAAPWS